MSWRHAVTVWCYALVLALTAASAVEFLVHGHWDLGTAEAGTAFLAGACVRYAWRAGRR
jgi:hypothetical protein